MIPATTFAGKRVAIFGLGISGLSAAKALVAGEALPVLWDENAERCQQARNEGFEVVDFKTVDWATFDALVLSPGVPLTHPEPHWTVIKARDLSLDVIGDTELFFSEFLARGESDRVIAITGTNGKSTTTALTTHLLKQAGAPVFMGGNIGLGVLDMPDFGAGNIYVLELSSYQIDLTPSLKPTVAGLLNITPDHLDRHGSIEHYAEVKSRIFDQLAGDARAVLSIDDVYCKTIAADLETDAKVFFVGSEGDLPQGARLSDRGFVLFEDGRAGDEIDLRHARALKGHHNAQNAAFAYLLAEKVITNAQALIAGFESFPGLAHRCQEIAQFDGAGAQRLLFVNDSKATNAQACATALSSFSEIYWIAGGRAKAGGIDSLVDQFGSVKKAFLIGEAAEDFGKTLERAGVSFEICGDISSATKAAFEAAKSEAQGEAAVLFSPAAASFDQYANFEVRGDAFCVAVGALEDVVMHPGL